VGHFVLVKSPGPQQQIQTMNRNELAGYRYTDGALNCSHDYLIPVVKNLLNQLALPPGKKRLFDLGCGNASVAGHLQQLGYEVTGIDPSEQGIRQANRNFPGVAARMGSAYDNLVAEYGTFPVVISLEVVEHVYFPRKYAATLYSLVEPSGVAIISTPYHSYVKNLVLSLTGKMEAHFTALWDHGHIKFWSFRTLRILLEEAGFESIDFHRAGRIQCLAKSMIAVARK